MKTKKRTKPLKTKRSTREKIEEAAIHLGGSDGDTNLASRIVLAALHVGPNVAKISNLLGVPSKNFRTMAANLRKNGCWKGDKVSVTDADNGDLLYIDAAIMSAVAMGWVESYIPRASKSVAKNG